MSAHTTYCCDVDGCREKTVLASGDCGIPDDWTKVEINESVTLHVCNFCTHKFLNTFDELDDDDRNDDHAKGVPVAGDIPGEYREG